MNSLDIFFGAIQGIVAFLLIFRIDGLPNFLIYFLAAALIISGIIDLFGA